jgi:subtilisin family serine protease
MRVGSRLIVLIAALAVALAAPARGATNDPLRSKQWGMTMIHADEAHATATGAGATVAVIDTGAYFDHPDLQGRLIAGHDFIDKDETPQDGEGHGTHVAGIVAANTNNGIGVEGVAPGAKVLVVRVLDNSGAGNTDDVAAGIDWAVDHGADVINLSLGPDVPLVGGSSAFDTAIDRALDRGLVVVAASGNSGLPSCDQPSGSGRLLCVNAVDRNGSKAFYSNFGDSLGISAPGGSAIGSETDDILSTYASSRPDLGFYNYVAGTSQATPHVAGVAALLVSLGVRGQAAVQRILATARDAGLPGPDAIYGAGIVDAQAAVAGLGKGGGGAGGGSGGGGSGGGGSGGSAVKISLSRVQKIRTVLRRGIVVRCTAAGTGRCRVRALRGKRTLASGSHAVTAGRAATVYARLNSYGRSVLLADLRRRHPLRLRLTLRIALPGAKTQTRTVTLKP